MISSLQRLFLSDELWNPVVIHQVTRLLAFDVPPAVQFPRRVLRSTIHKLVIAVNRELMVMAVEPEKAAGFEKAARSILAGLLDPLEQELYALCDAVEGCLSSSHATIPSHCRSRLFMSDAALETLNRNRLWLGQAAPSLAAQLTDQVVNSVQFRERRLDGDTADYDLFFGDELALETCLQSLTVLLNQQLTRTDGVAMPRPSRSSTDLTPAEPAVILSEMVNKHREVLIDHLPAIPLAAAPQSLEKPPYRNLVIFGSLMLVPLLRYLQSQAGCPWISLTLFEDDPKQLAATLSLVDLAALVDLCKENAISLKLHVDDIKLNLQDRLYTQVSSDNPTLLYGWQTLRSPVRSPALIELHSWLHAPEGAAQHLISLLGFATDEINQTQQALWNALNQKPLRVLEPERLSADTPVVLVASGPSLNDQLDWLRDHQTTLNLVAAGGALGALLRSGIRPVAVVFLERMPACMEISAIFLPKASVWMESPL